MVAYVYLFVALRAAFGIDDWNALRTVRFLRNALGTMFLSNWLVY